MAKHEYLDVTHLVVHEKLEAGHLRLTDTSWDDLRFPVQAVNPQGQASDPDVEATTGMLLFDAGATELVFGVAQMPHGWKEGTSVYPHVHWSKSTSAGGDVLWQLDYEVNGISAIAALDYGTQLQQTSSVNTDNDTANEHLISAFGELAMTSEKISTMIIWKLSRIGGDAADTYGADARLMEIDFHYEIDSFGSNTAFSKGE